VRAECYVEAVIAGGMRICQVDAIKAGLRGE